MFKKNILKAYMALLSPIIALKFLLKNKYLLFLSFGPHVIFFAIYILLLKLFFIDSYFKVFYDNYVGAHINFFTKYIFTYLVAQSLIWVLLLVLYSVIGFFFVNAVASPLYDIVAQKTYEQVSKEKLRDQNFKEILNSLLSELIKFIIIVALFIASFFLQVLAPVSFLFYIWYLGWSQMDRTLALMNWKLRERFYYGLRNFLSCFSLGVWLVIPFLGMVFAGSIASAAAYCVAQNKKIDKRQT